MENVWIVKSGNIIKEKSGGLQLYPLVPKDMVATSTKILKVKVF